MKKPLFIFAVFYSLLLPYSTYAQQWYSVVSDSAVMNANLNMQDVNAMTVGKNDTLYIAGDLSNGTAPNSVMKFNGATWANVGNLLSVVPSANLGPIYAITTDTSGNLYASVWKRILKWNGSTWTALDTTQDFSTTLAMLGSKSGYVYAAGTYKDGNNNPYLVRWDGSSWTSIQPVGNYTATNPTVNAMAEDNNGNIYIAGSFTDTTGHCYVAKYNGTSFTELGTGTHALKANAQINALAIDAAGNVYAAGAFTVNNTPTNVYVAKWNGTDWIEVGSGTNPLQVTPYRTLSALTIDSTGKLYAGGHLTGGPLGYIFIAAQWNGSTWNDSSYYWHYLNQPEYQVIFAGAVNTMCSHHGVVYAAGNIPDQNNSYGQNTVLQFNCIPPVAQFSDVTLSNPAYHNFTYTGPGGIFDSLLWNFGDGSPNQSQPCYNSINLITHSFSSPGTYHVCVTASNNCSSNSTCKDITVALGVNNIAMGANTLNIYPNPATNEVSIEGQGSLRIIDIAGREVLQTQLVGNMHHIVDISGLSNGMYFCSLRNEGIVNTGKLSVAR